MAGRLRHALQPLFRRVPRLRGAALSALDVAARPLLLPFRLDRPPSSAHATATIERQTDAFNAAAEKYFAEHLQIDHLLDKPFSEPESLSRRLVDAGVLLDALRVRPGDTVLELGAGSCWLSHLLNRFGCRTISVDVSATALSVGRQLFERDPRTNWQLDPVFLPYDGWTLPVDAGSVDQIVIYDAYHHLPNAQHLLGEMRRVLKADGIVAMSEPGRGHAMSGSSLAESAGGVLENELVLEDIAESALSAGFVAARVVVAANTPLLEVDARELRRFMGGRGFARYWKNLCAALDGHHYIVLFAGQAQPTTRRPHQLKAVIRSEMGRGPLTVGPGEPVRVAVEILNGGDTRWLHTADAPGWTRVGVHLYRDDAARTLLDFDWARVPLPRDVDPDERVRLTLPLLPIAEPGSYLAVVDLVVEGVTWFAERGSASIDVGITVR
jgi:SAM-dependent methyltransferase